MSNHIETISDEALANVSGGIGYPFWATFFYNYRKGRQQGEQQPRTPPPQPGAGQPE